MKCPKCNYLGFETSDRCKHCGYDFSLLAADSSSDNQSPELSLRTPLEAADDHSWSDRLHVTTPASEGNDPLFGVALRGAGSTPTTPSADVGSTPVAAATSFWEIGDDSPLPLFTRPGEEHDDQPLVKLPAAPRPPLAVRRSADTPRIRSVPRAAEQPEPRLDFVESAARPDHRRTIVAKTSRASIALPTSGPARRLGAAALDYAMLMTIDVGVIYFTLRMSGLYMSDWRLLPVAPLTAFLLLIKFAYFWAFTAARGQTIGKMAARIVVIAIDDDTRIDGGRALGRTMAGTLSLATLGLGFLPALFGAEHRALHDRLARTRVVRLRST